MKVRILWVPPHERNLKCGKVYDLPETEAKHLVGARDAEVVDDGVEAEDDPRPEAVAARAEAAERAEAQALADEAAAKAAAAAAKAAK